MENINDTQEMREGAEPISIKKLLSKFAENWKWFLVSVCIFTFLGVAYVITRQPVYERSMSILIQDQSDGEGTGSVANSFASLGLVTTSNNVNNELYSLTSPDVMLQVVRDLNLNINYFLKGFPHGTTLYGSNLPFCVEFPDIPEGLGVTFSIKVNPNGSMKLFKFVTVENNTKTKYKDEVEVPHRFGEVKTPVGLVRFVPNPKFNGIQYDEPKTIVVSRSGYYSALERYSRMLKGELASRDADIINLTIDDVSKERADDILNKVLEVYKQKWITDKNSISETTETFLTERLHGIEEELGSVDNDIMVYRKEHYMPNLVEAGKLNLATSRQNDQEILTVTSQLSMAKYVEDYVNNPANIKKVIPMNTGGTNSMLETQIANYNSLLLARNNLAESTSLTNPLVKDYDSQLAGMHEAIERGLNNQVVSLTTTLRNLESERGKLQSQLAQEPEMQRHLQSIERQLKVKEQLYLFLLQKREENQLSQKFMATNTRVITPPMGPIRPVAPRKMVIVAMAFLFGLFLPAASIYVKELTDTKVRSTKDLEKLTTPVIGEIPFIGKRDNWLKKLIKKNKQTNTTLETLPYVVSPGKRDMINESFRIVRGNIDFMMRKNASNEVIMVTSLNAGSGKSFITYNLCAAFAIKGKRVLLIDCDLRHGSTSQFIGMPKKGLASVLTGHTADWRDNVVKVSDEASFDLLPIGYRPPNPAELLESDYIKTLLEEAKSEYDLVFLDCPPIDVVVDTQTLSPMADRTLLVARAGLLDKSALDNIDIFYANHRFNNLAILLNCTIRNAVYGNAKYADYYSTI